MLTKLLVLLPALLLAQKPLLLSGNTNEVLEWSYTSAKPYSSPFFDADVELLVTYPDAHTALVPGFWAGENTWTFRFSSPQPGEHRFVTQCTDRANRGLHGQKGTLRLIKYAGSNPLYQHGPVRVADNNRNFVHQDRTPFFWLADSWWFGMCQRLKWPEDFQLLVADRRAKGFSVIQFAVGFACDIAPFDERDANEAGFAWTKNYQTINPAYFDLTDLRIQWLVRSGMIPNIVAAWGYYLPDMGVEKMKKHWRYLIARYGAYPVNWTLAGEVTMAWYLTDDKAAQTQFQREKWAEVGRYVRQIDPYHHLLTVHPGGQGVSEPLTDMSVVDFTMAMPGHGGFHTMPRAMSQLNDLRTRYPNKPAMQGEISFEGMYGSSKEDVQRQFFWTNMLSGAAGHCYGVDALWQFNTLEKPFGLSPDGHIWGNTPWEIAYQWPGSTQVGIGKKILEKLDWSALLPNQALVQPAASEKDVFLAYCAATPDDGLRVLYFPRGIPSWNKNVILKNLTPNARYVAQFIDPITGRQYDEMPFAADTAQTWPVPFSPILQDWVLVVTKLP